MITRRNLLLTSVAASAVLSTPAMGQSSRSSVALRKLQALEQGHARLGVCFMDAATGESCGTRLDERFAMCSTFKLAMVAACLREADHGRLNMAQVLEYSEADMLPWAPVTKEHLSQGGLSITTLAKAALQRSDGTAANLLVDRLGGPSAVTAMIKDMGDTVTRLDRYEPDLGLVLSADMRDTSSPLAYAQLARQIFTGRILQKESRELLLNWAQNTTTGARRLRAGLPQGWRTGNKTGSGRTEGTTNKCNDIAITFPPNRNPIIITAYFDSGEYTEKIEARHEAVLAEVGKIAAEWAISDRVIS